MKYLLLGSSPNAWAAGWALAQAGQQVELLEWESDFGGPDPWPGLQLIPELAQGGGFQEVTWPGRAALRADGSLLILTPSALLGQPLSQDAERWLAFVELMERAAGWLAPSLLSPLAQPSFPSDPELLRLPWMSLRDFLNRWFVDDCLKGLLAEVALEGAYQGPFAPASAFLLLRRWCQGQVLKPVLTQGWLQALRRSLPWFHLPGQPRLLWQGQRATALELAGSTRSFDMLLCDKSPDGTFNQLLAGFPLGEELLQGLKGWRQRGRAWLAPAGGTWPTEWPLLPLHWRPSLLGLERAWDQVKWGQPLEQGPLQLWPSAQDRAVMALGGYGPTGLKQLGLEVRWDQGQKLPCPGELDLAQSFSLRPFPGYRSPLANLQLCGSCLHPGDWSGRAGLWTTQRLD